VVTLAGSAQIGKTVIANIFLGRSMSMDPCDFLVVHPTDDNASRWSKLKLSPMLKGTDSLRGLFPEKSRDGSNSVLLKEHRDGLGAILISGANSPSSLSQVTMRRQVQDDLSKWEMNAAGDPESQADSRSRAHEFAKILKASTPLVLPGCRITKTTQKDQMLSGASPTAVAAAQKSPAETPPPSVEAPAAPEPAAAAPVVAAAAAKPKPGETCTTCGQVMPDNDDDGMPVDPNASAPGYTVEMAMETMDLCAIAKLPLSEAKAFVNAKTPIATVRGELARRVTDAMNALAVDGTARPAGATEAAVAATWDSVVQEINGKMSVTTRR
jgi:Phage terminase large subunit (GpA)